jgi:hypothetical protein
MSLYKINNETISATNAKTYVQAGIQDNLKLVDVQFKTVERTGNQFLAFYFEDKLGNPLSYTEWPPKPSKPIEAMSLEEKSKYLEFYIGWPMGRLRQILEVFKGEIDYDKTPIEGNTFKEIVEKFIAVLGDSYKDKLVRVKVVYDNKGYTTLPKNPKFTFIEDMSVSKEDSKIQVLPGDLFERPAKGDVEKQDTIPSAFSSNNTKTDDIPF